MQEDHASSDIDNALPLRFYDAKRWLKNLVVYYSETHHLLPAGVLMVPLAGLTRSVENVINIYGNFPKPTIRFLRQTTNPLYEPNEYYNSVYLRIKDVANKEDKPSFFILAESLLYIRQLFEANPDFIEDYFQKELHLMEGDDDERMQSFAKIMSDITSVHVNQISKLIKAESKQSSSTT